MKTIYILFISLIIFSCKSEIHSDNEKFVLTKDGNTSLFYKNSFENGAVKDSSAASKFNNANKANSLGYLEDARELYELSNHLEPNNIEILNALGGIYNVLEKPNKSNKYFQKSLLIDSLHSITYLNYGFAKSENKEYNKAIELYERGVSLESSGEKRGYFYYNMSRTFYKKSEYKRAMEYLNKSIELVNNKIIRKQLFDFKEELENY
jgi:tetratricopeptide (TPR) repeat protein